MLGAPFLFGAWLAHVFHWWGHTIRFGGWGIRDLYQDLRFLIRAGVSRAGHVWRGTPSASVAWDVFTL